MSELSQLIAPARHDEVWQQLLREARDVSDYSVMQRLCRARRKLVTRARPPALPAAARVALLGTATTSMLEAPLKLILESMGVASTLYAPPFGTFAREMLDGSSETVRFAPDVAILLSTPASVPAWPRWNASQAEVDVVIDQACEYWIGLCRTLHEHARCDVVLSNFHMLALRPLGTAAAHNPGEANRFLAGLNEALARRAPSYVHIHDVASLAALYGVYRWFDLRYWYHARQPVSFECLVPYVRSIAQIIAALRGRSAKCVVVDLDNTLWGGVVGDDGVEHLVVGEGDPRGEAFTGFQRYLRALKERGVMLAVCSKNEESAALAPFEVRPEMVLRRDDFVAFQANWRPKSENLREIAAALNIGLDAMVFIDDNPAEREQIRQTLPEVKVVELSDDPGDFAILLDRTGWLDAVTVSDEDVKRSRMYQENEARSVVQAAVGDYAEYVRSLGQYAVVAPFEERHLDRITQLTNKTNQFNLTTRRLARPELSEMMISPHYLTTYVRLADRFGDNGLISVFAARAEGDDLWIELWLMSCRVFARGVEQMLCNHVVQSAMKMGFARLHGIYIPTERNGVVKDHYASMGFVPSGSRDGNTIWTLELETYAPFDTAIRIVDSY